MHTVYRVQSIDGEIGPWFFKKDKQFEKDWDKRDATIYEDNGHNDAYEKFPVWANDFPNLDSLKNHRIAVHIPCLIYYWFGMNLDLLKNNFGLFEIKVKNYFIGESKLQVVYHKSDFISETLLIKF